MQSTKMVALALVISLALLFFAACSNRVQQNSEALSNSNAPSSQSEPTPPPSSQAVTNENTREANEPFELIGMPDLIYIVTGEKERTIEPGTDEYNEILELLRSRFPNKLKEAAKAITWADESGFNQDFMREEFDFLELSYDEAQTVELNCMDNADYPIKEITFEMMIFPLSASVGTVSIDTHKTDSLVGRSYGPLDDSGESIAEILRYLD
jgi:hypothetical protein